MLRSCFFWRSHTCQHCVFLFGLLQLVYLHNSTWPICTPLPMQRYHPTLLFKLDNFLRPSLYLLPLHPPHPVMFLAVFLSFLLPLSPDSLRIFQWNVGGLQAKSTELLHFVLSHPLDLICIQESNLNSSSPF